MIVTFITDHTCPQCGHHNHNTAIANIRINRINRTHYRTLWPTIGTPPTSCRECRGPLADHPDQHDLHPDDTTHINTWRTHRGWAAA